MRKCCPIDSDFIFDQNFLMHAGKEDIHKILDECDFGPDRTIHFGATHPWGMENFPIDL